MSMEPVGQLRALNPVLDVETAPASSMTPLLALFIVGAVTVAALTDWNYAVKGIGLVLALVYVVYSYRARVWPSGEVALFALWITWCLTGVFVSASAVLFQEAWMTVAQIVVLLAIVSGLTSSRRVFSLNLACLLIGVAIVGGYSWMTGEYAEALTGTQEESRVSGLAMNANEFGWIMILATVCLAYFWMMPSRRPKLRRGLLFVGLAATGMAILLSGSRKAILGLALFYVLWPLFCFRKGGTRARRMAIILAVVVSVLVGLAIYMLASELPVAKRFEETYTAIMTGSVQSGGMDRLQLMRLAWNAFLSNPLVGLGLNNFVVFSRGTAAHSEYAEVLADTGLIGFVLYFSIYLVMWRRAGKIAKYCPDPVAVRVARLVRVFLIVVMALNLGRYNYTDKPFWILMGSFAGYTAVVWRYWRPRVQILRRTAPVMPALQGSFRST
jgi:O-antigen ligase